MLRILLPTLLLTILSGAAPAPQAVPRTAPPKRIVSLNMCADQLVIALADRDQIAGLTEWARDPQLSYYADRAKSLPYTHRSAEEVLALHPDVVIGAPYRTRSVLTPLKARGIPMVDMPYTEGFDGVKDSIRTVATAVGHPERGEAMIAKMDADLARIGPPPGQGRIAAYYQRQGYLSGTGTLVDDMFHRVGLTNLATKISGSTLAQLSLEQMALARPDFLVMDAGTRAVADRGAAMLHHPLLDSVVPNSHRAYIPQALTVCGGPFYPQAVAMLADQICAADHAQAMR